MTSRSEIAVSRESGFTLVELIVVLTIIGLVTALIVTSQARVSPAVHARAAAQAISGALREARSEAVMLDRSVSFTLDVADRSYRWGRSPKQKLSDDLRLSMLLDRGELQAGSIGNIRFDPDGGSSGGRISIEGGSQTWSVGVDWLSGRVTIESGPR